MALIDFTLSNARRFYLSMGNPLGWKGLSKLENTNQFHGTVLGFEIINTILLKFEV